MYRWQTLTLARVEQRMGRDEPFGDGGATWRSEATTLLGVIRDFLYRVGQRHFPEPDVAASPCAPGAAPTISLHWGVDGRDLWFNFDPRRIEHSSLEPDGTPYSSGGIDPSSPGEIRELFHWVLFGERPPKPVAAPARVPRPGDPLSPHHPESVADRRRSAP